MSMFNIASEKINGIKLMDYCRQVLCNIFLMYNCNSFFKGTSCANEKKYSVSIIVFVNICKYRVIALYLRVTFNYGYY